MRTTTAQQDAVLARKDRSVHVRVFVDRGVADWVDLTDIDGRCWLRSVEYSGSIDKTTIEATVRVQHRIEGLSLSPLMAGSKLNASGVILEIGHPIYIQTATMPLDTPPAAADWVEVFRGEIDEVQWNTNPIQLRCRDQSGALDRFIETQVKRPYTLEVDHVEHIIQEILDTEFGEGVVTLYSITGDAVAPFKVVDSPNWLIPSYVQRKQPVIQALRILADQIGWYIRYIWNESTGAFELTLYEPGREIAAQGAILLYAQPVVGNSFVLNATTISCVAGAPAADQFQVGGTVAVTAANIAAALMAGTEAGNITKAWTTGAAYASGTLTFTGQPAALGTMVINVTTITCVAGAPGADEFQLGGTLAATLDNLVTTLRETCAEAENLTAARIGSTVKIAWGTAGYAGESIVFTEALTNCTADGAGTLGGTDSGATARVVVEWGTKGTAGNAIVWTEALANCTADGGGTLGGTLLGQGTSVDYTVGPDRYYDVAGLKISRAGVRNVVRVKYGVSQLDRTTIEVSDAASIAKYGRRWMEIAEGGTSQIDTESEATQMANAILGDLSEPDADQSVEMPYLWTADLGDFVRFEANGYHYDSDQDLAVLGFSHVLSGDRSRTTLSCRGKPSGGSKRWLALEARPGVAPQNDFYQGAAAEGVTASAGQGVIIVKYDDPRSMSPPVNNWAFTNCFVDTISAFTPSDANFAGVGRTTRFDITGLIPGQTYYIKLQIIDGSGNVALTTTQVSTAAEKTTAYHEDSDTIRMSLVPNGTFGQFVRGLSVPPDGWEVYAGVWGTDVYPDGQSNDQSGYSIAMGPDGAEDESGLISDFIPLSPDDVYSIRYACNGTVAVAPAFATLYVGFRLYDAQKVVIQDSNLTPEAALPIAGWRHSSRTFTPGFLSGLPHVRYARLYFKRRDATLTGITVRIDTVEMMRQTARFRSYRNAVQAVASGVFTQVAFNVDSYDYGEMTSRARGTLTLTGNPVAAETFVINATTFTARAAGAGADEFNIGATKELTAANIVTMLRAGSEAANITAWIEGALVHVEWLTAGVAGNAVTFTEALTNATANGGGTLGGTVLGGVVYGHDTVTNIGRFTALQPGEYSFATSVGLTALADGNQAEIEFRVNGVAVGGGVSLVMGGAGNVRLVGSMQWSLSVGDYVEVFEMHNFGAARNITAGTNETYFTGARIAAGG